MARPPLAPPQLSPVPMEPGLYLVATPIGNLRDITLRALDVLAACDLILAEDTRVTGKLLAAYGISKRIERCDDHAAERIIPRVLERLAEGGKIALVTDAGTPLVSDPGFVVARAVIAAGQRVWPIPGASAALAALAGRVGGSNGLGSEGGGAPSQRENQVEHGRIAEEVLGCFHNRERRVGAAVFRSDR